MNRCHPGLNSLTQQPCTFGSAYVRGELDIPLLLHRPHVKVQDRQGEAHALCPRGLLFAVRVKM